MLENANACIPYKTDHLYINNGNRKSHRTERLRNIDLGLISDCFYQIIK